MKAKLQKHENTEIPPDHKSHNSKLAAHSRLSASSSDEQNLPILLRKAVNLSSI